MPVEESLRSSSWKGNQGHRRLTQEPRKSQEASQLPQRSHQGSPVPRSNRVGHVSYEVLRIPTQSGKLGAQSSDFTSLHNQGKC